tara:strand:- start:2317 stop:2946 length:630 start_codon:yes stop_codon:yes gene_type:complete
MENLEKSSKKEEKREKRKRGTKNKPEGKEKTAPSWVLKEGEELPQMTAKRTRSYYLPMRTIADDEAELVLPDESKGEVPCCYGSKCTSVEDICGGPMVPIKAMKNSTSCLLCHRKGMRSKYVRHTILEQTIPTNKLVQRWESPVGKGGYRLEACVGRHPKHYNGFLSHVAIGTTPDYTWMCDPSTGKWKIDQSLMYEDFQGASPTTQHL